MSYGDCWCCAGFGLSAEAVSTVGLCRPCGGRSPSACQTRHAKEAAARQTSPGSAGESVSAGELSPSGSPGLTPTEEQHAAGG